MMNLLWSQFDVNQSSKDISFESFCFQIAYNKYSQYGFFDSFFNTPGSEFYLILHTDCSELNLKAGDKIGWQAKWWYNTEDSTSLTKDKREQLSKNFSTTLKTHADIKLWIICTPGSFTESTYKKLVDCLKEKSPQTEFVHWNKASFKNILLADHVKFGGIFHHYFNTNFIHFEFLRSYTQGQIDYLHKKFDTDLYVPSHHDEEILSLLNYNEIFNELELKSSYIRDDIKLVSDWIDNWDFSGFLSIDYSTNFIQLIELITETLNSICDVLETTLTIEKCRYLNDLIDKYFKEYGRFAAILNKLITEDKWAKDEATRKDKWRNQDIIEKVHILHSHIAKIENYEKKVRRRQYEPIAIQELLACVFQKCVHVLSSAGYGKTNIACSIAKNCLERGIPAVLLLGSNFRKSELPQRIIVEYLGIDGNYNFKQFLHAINNLGFLKGFKIPIIIDGLNESNPYKDIWRTNIKDIIREINNLDYVCLVSTCRDRYVNSIFEVENVSEIENTYFLEGLSEKQKDSAIRKYFTKYNITPSSWNFNKDLFKHPLLLRIFSEANENSENINISVNNIFNSVEKYYENIVEKATGNDPLLKANVHKRIVQLCVELWERNTRDIDLETFVSILSPNSDTLANTIADKVLDEGLCLFQKNLDESDNENIQFAYDLVAGYLIASRVLLNKLGNISDLKQSLLDSIWQDKLFSTHSAHPLSEDILISLLYLIPLRYDVELFEVCDNSVCHEICYRNIDYYIGNSIGLDKIKNLHTETTQNTETRKLLLKKLFENIFQKKVYGLSDFSLSILIPFKPVDIDIFWSEILRENTRLTYSHLEEINKRIRLGLFSNHDVQDCFYQSYLCTVSVNEAIRDLATENLYLIGRSFPSDLLEYCRLGFQLNDGNARESLMAAVCGAILTVKSKELTDGIISFLTNDFLRQYPTTHVGIIEYTLTIVEFGYSEFKLDYRNEVIFENNFAISTKVRSNKKQYSRFNVSLYGVDMYNFVKYQIAHISSDSYYERDTYPESVCTEIILNRVKDFGYCDDLFAPINKSFEEDRSYRYGYASKVKSYAEKYLWQSYFEFVGHLYLESKLKSEDKNRYRCLELRYDPTFPKLPTRNQLIADCFFPAKDEDVQNWINCEKNDFIDHYYTHKLYTENEWILLSASLHQEGKENDTRFNLYVTAFLVPSENIDKLDEDVAAERFHANDQSYFYNIYAGEIAWSKFARKLERDYEESKYNFTDLVWDYRWSSWSQTRFENPSFPFLNTKLARSMKLTFDLTDLSYYNNKKEQVTKIMWTESSQLYYIRKDVMLEIIRKQKMNLVWYQFSSKYGEFGTHHENKLKPSYQDLRKLVRFSS